MQTLANSWARATKGMEILAVEFMTGEWKRRLLRHQAGQDLIEYALMTAAIAVAVAAIFPQSLAPSMSTIFSKVTSSLGAANN